MKYFLNEYYKYPNGKKIFLLKETNGFIFRFYCGHWCTDTVFSDLIRVKNGVQNYKDNQLELF